MRLAALHHVEQAIAIEHLGALDVVYQGVIADHRHAAGAVAELDDVTPLLTERTRAYGSRHLERFLAWLGRVGAAEQFTDALARWTMQCWQPAANAQAMKGQSVGSGTASGRA